MDGTASPFDDGFDWAVTATDPVTPIDAVAWKLLCHLFESTVALAPRDREGFLRSHCPLEPSLRRTLLRMLDAHDGPNAMDAVSDDLTTLRDKLWSQTGSKR